MGETAEATLRAVIDGYKGKLPETVLEQFHDDVRVVGTKSLEFWESRSAVTGPLEAELNALDSITGTLPNLTGLSEEELAEKIKPADHEDVGFGCLTEEGEVVFNGQTLHGRWTCVVRRFGQGDWQVVQSHFSVPEPEPDVTPS